MRSATRHFGSNKHQIAILGFFEKGVRCRDASLIGTARCVDSANQADAIARWRVSALSRQGVGIEAEASASWI